MQAGGCRRPSSRGRSLLRWRTDLPCLRRRSVRHRRKVSDATTGRLNPASVAGRGQDGHAGPLTRHTKGCSRAIGGEQEKASSFGERPPNGGRIVGPIERYHGPDNSCSRRSSSFVKLAETLSCNRKERSHVSKDANSKAPDRTAVPLRRFRAGAAARPLPNGGTPVGSQPGQDRGLQPAHHSIRAPAAGPAGRGRGVAGRVGPGRSGRAGTSPALEGRATGFGPGTRPTRLLAEAVRAGSGAVQRP